jgi:hypothetical protein
MVRPAGHGVTCMLMAVFVGCVPSFSCKRAVSELARTLLGKVWILDMLLACPTLYC